MKFYEVYYRRIKTAQWRECDMIEAKNMTEATKEALARLDFLGKVSHTTKKKGENLHEMDSGAQILIKISD